jgi:SCP-2 sterol transfer family
VATRKQVESKLRELIERLDSADEEVRRDLSRAISDRRIVQMDVSDLNASFWTDLDDGSMGPLRRGSAPNPHIRVIADSDDLIDLIDGNRNLFSSYLAGHIKVQASLSDLLTLRRLL